MRTGRVPHERQRNEDSSFQIGVIRAHDPAAPDHFTFLGAHRWPLERPWRGSVLGKERTRDAIGTAVCEPLFDHSKSRSHLRALPSDEPLRRQPASDAGRVSRLSRARCAERRHRARISPNALGHAATAEGRRAPITNIRNVPSELRAAGTLTKKST
jgi:hypothetical protein